MKSYNLWRIINCDFGQSLLSVVLGNFMLLEIWEFMSYISRFMDSKPHKIVDFSIFFFNARILCHHFASDMFNNYA